MDALNAVEKEVDRASELFDTYYESVDQDINKVIDYVVAVVNDLLKSMCSFALNVSPYASTIDIPSLLEQLRTSINWRRQRPTR